MVMDKDLGLFKVGMGELIIVDYFAAGADASSPGSGASLN